MIDATTVFGLGFADFKLFGELGVLAGAFILLLRWTLGTLLSAFKDGMKTQTEAITKLSRSVAVNSLMITAFGQQLLAHDLTVTGINPSTGKDAEGRDSKAYERYNRLGEQFAQIREQVAELAKE